MSYIVIDCQQKSAEWFAARCGRLTSSDAHIIFAKGKSKDSEAVTKRDLRIRLATEQISGHAQGGSSYQSEDMKYGTEREPDARLAYEASAGVLLRTPGFLSHAELMIGASPDGVVGECEGGAELKCPKTFTHMEYLRAGVLPSDYLPQMQHHLLVSGAEYWDFVSFDDRLPEAAQLFVRRLWAKDAGLDAYAASVRAFLADVAKEKAEILALCERLAGAAA